jgi:hypothetical protein
MMIIVYNITADAATTATLTITTVRFNWIQNVCPQ